MSTPVICLGFFCPVMPFSLGIRGKCLGELLSEHVNSSAGTVIMPNFGGIGAKNIYLAEDHLRNIFVKVLCRS